MDIKSKLREWILKRSKQPIRREELTDDTPVIDSGLLSSLDIVEFVLYMESIRGDEIDPDSLDPASFISTNTMYEAFFSKSVS